MTRTVLLPSAIFERERSDKRTNDSTFYMKTLNQGSICASLPSSDCNIKARGHWNLSYTLNMPNSSVLRFRSGSRSPTAKTQGEKFTGWDRVRWGLHGLVKVRMKAICTVCV